MVMDKTVGSALDAAREGRGGMDLVHGRIADLAAIDMPPDGLVRIEVATEAPLTVSAAPTAGPVAED